MTPLQFERISLFKVAGEGVIGFHNENLEIATLNPKVWESAVSKQDSQELRDLKAWSDSTSSQCQNAPLDEGIKTLTINATQLCNLHCVYCAAGGDGSYGAPELKIKLEKALPQVQWILSRMERGASMQVNFLGGEPLLYPETIHAIAAATTEMARDVGVQMRFAVVTNGTRLAEQKIQQLLLDWEMAVTVSVDGPPEIQDRFRPSKNGEGSSQQVERGLQALQAIRKKLPSIGLSAVFHRSHLDVLNTYQYFRHWDFDYYELNYSHTEFDSMASQRFSDELSEVLKYADNRGGEEELRKIRSIDSLFLRLDEQVRALNFCGSGRTLLSMDARGDLFACPWDINDRQARLNAQVGVLAERGARYQRPQVKKTDCQMCWARNLCGGGCSYIHSQGTKKENGVDPFFCERTQSLIKTVIIYYEKYRRSADEQH